MPHLPVALIEEPIVGRYTTLRLPPDFASDVNTLLESTLADEQGTIHASHASLEARLAELDGQEEGLLDLSADGTLPQAKIKVRLQRIQAHRATTKAAVSSVTAELAAGTGVLHEALGVLSNPHAMHRDADGNTRRLMNHTFYERFYVDDLT
ncbi:hypothetical protein [Nocardia iowensis]|uniref:Uncharacterized protein n=1 Tax=Nocardia iowensis TaxID=204891 RepID=A0ABX8RMH4_NOCIO|nr:hypothetical protein [Nocardia iowensis]QXN90835.1 hypothetical protein KV110_36635 [Nocardia iowensis]